MEQLALAFTPPGIGHNQSPEAMDPIEGLNARLTESHADLFARFRNLKLACGQVPDPIANEEDAATATEFIAQCKLQVKQADAVHKAEKQLFLKAGRAIDAVFKGRCERLGTALMPIVARLTVYRERIAAAERQRYEEARERAAEETRQALTEADTRCTRAGPTPRSRRAVPRR